MRYIFGIPLVFLSCVVLFAFVVVLISSSQTRVVLSRFDPTLREPIPEAPYIPPRTLTQGEYILEAGTITFSLGHSTEIRDSSTGIIPLPNARLTLNISRFGKWSGDGVFIIDMKDLAFTQDTSTYDLTSSDFFAIEEHPYATLTVNSMEQMGTSTVFTLKGRLTLRGQTHDVVIPAATLYVKDNTLVFDTDFTFNRTQWGMTRASPSISGTIGSESIPDEVMVKLFAKFPLPAE